MNIIRSTDNAPETLSPDNTLVLNHMDIVSIISRLCHLHGPPGEIYRTKTTFISEDDNAETPDNFFISFLVHQKQNAKKRHEIVSSFVEAWLTGINPDLDDINVYISPSQDSISIEDMRRLFAHKENVSIEECKPTPDLSSASKDKN